MSVNEQVRTARRLARKLKLTAPQIAANMGVSQDTVEKWLDPHKRVKLRPAFDAEEMRKLRATDPRFWTIQRLAEYFTVSRAKISAAFVYEPVGKPGRPRAFDHDAMLRRHAEDPTKWTPHRLAGQYGVSVAAVRYVIRKQELLR